MSKIGESKKKIIHFYCHTCKAYELKTSSHYRNQKQRFARRRKAKEAAITSVALILVLLAVAPAKVNGSDRLTVCNAAANFARSVADARDHGVPSEKVRAIFTKQPMRAYDRDTINAEITLIYGNPNLTPDRAAATLLEGCMKKEAHD